MAVCALAVRFRRTKDRHVSRSVGRGVSGRAWSGPIFAFFCRVSSFCRTLQGFVSVLHSLLAPFAQDCISPWM